ncbi:hypothetical protein ABVN80_19205 [Acinetobacter baumannii]
MITLVRDWQTRDIELFDIIELKPYLSFYFITLLNEQEIEA